MLKSQFPNWITSKFTFEEAAMKAMSTVFTGVIIKGFLFFIHFSRCIWRKLESLILKKDKHSLVSLYYSLTFLAQYSITEGWNYIETEFKTYPAAFQGFLKYFHIFWIKDSMISFWCTWRERHRTTNCLEGWHHKVNSDASQEQ